MRGRSPIRSRTHAFALLDHSTLSPLKARSRNRRRRRQLAAACGSIAAAAVAGGTAPCFFVVVRGFRRRLFRRRCGGRRLIRRSLLRRSRILCLCRRSLLGGSQVGRVLLRSVGVELTLTLLRTFFFCMLLGSLPLGGSRIFGSFLPFSISSSPFGR